MTRRSNNIEIFKEHLQALHRGHDDTVRHITTSREIIERSYELLRLADTIEASSKRKSHSAPYSPPPPG